MRDIAEFDGSAILGVLTDVDDTLTTDARLEPAAYDALWRLSRAGIAVIPVTGRSAGWAHMMLAHWPVTAVVAESGGLYLFRDPGTHRLHTRYHASENQVAADRAMLRAGAARVMAAVPGLRPASDNPFRFVDLALDYCEEVPRVPDSEVERAIGMFQAEGISARASSVHINVWIGDFDKAPMARRCLRELFADTPLADPDRWAFIGDAPNDASMFSAFRHGVGVANIVPVLDRLPKPPAYVTRSSSGAGFIEFCERLLASRR